MTPAPKNGRVRLASRRPKIKPPVRALPSPKPPARRDAAAGFLVVRLKRTDEHTRPVRLQQRSRALNGDGFHRHSAGGWMRNHGRSRFGFDGSLKLLSSL
jgi:hypothetical protein